MWSWIAWWFWFWLSWWVLPFHVSKLGCGAPMIMWMDDDTCWCMIPLMEFLNTFGISKYCSVIFIWLASWWCRTPSIVPLLSLDLTFFLESFNMDDHGLMFMRWTPLFILRVCKSIKVCYGIDYTLMWSAPLFFLMHYYLMEEPIMEHPSLVGYFLTCHILLWGCGILGILVDGDTWLIWLILPWI